MAQDNSIELTIDDDFKDGSQEHDGDEASLYEDDQVDVGEISMDEPMIDSDPVLIDGDDSDDSAQPAQPAEHDESAEKRQKMARMVAIAAGVALVGVVGAIGYPKVMAAFEPAAPAFAAGQSGSIGSPAAAPVAVNPFAEQAPVQPEMAQPVQMAAAEPVVMLGTAAGDPEAQAAPAVTQVQPDPAAAVFQAEAPAPMQASDTAHVEALEARLAELQESNAALKASEAELKHKVSGLSQERTELLKRVSAERKASAHKVAPVRVQKSTVSLEHYSVRVVRQGLAWIDVGNGRTVAVRPGDTIPNGPRVLSIDPDSGVVKTSAGLIRP